MRPSSRLTRPLTHLVDLSHRRPWTLVAVFAALLFVAAKIAAGLTLRGDFVELLPPDAEEVRDLRLVEEKAGGDGYLVVQLTGGTRDDRRAFGADLARRLEAETELVRYVDFHFDTRLFEDRALWLLSVPRLRSLRDDLVARIEYDKSTRGPFALGLDDPGPPPPDFDAIERKYRPEELRGDYLESKDGSELYLFVKATQLASDLDFDRRLLARARELSREAAPVAPEVSVAFTGSYVILLEDNAVMGDDIVKAGAVATVLALLFLLLSTRRLSALLIVAAPVALGIAAAFAFARAIIGHLNPVTGFLGAILIGIGVEHGVHLTLRYREERAHHEPLPAMRRAVTGTFPGALTSAATNAAAFFVLVFADLSAFRQFGQIAAFGVMSTLAAAYLAGPPLLFLAERVRPARANKPSPATADSQSRDSQSRDSQSRDSQSCDSQSRDSQSRDSQSRDSQSCDSQSPDNPPPERAPSRAARGPRRWPASALIGVVTAILGFAAYSAVVSSRVGFATDLRALKGESAATALEDHITEQLGIVLRPSVLYVRSLADARAASQIAREMKASAGERTSFADILSIDDLLPADVDAKRPLLRDIEDALASVPARARDDRLRRAMDLARAEPWTARDLPASLQRRFTPIDGDGTFVLLFPKSAGYDSAELDAWARDLDELMRRLRARGVEAHLLDGNRIAARVMGLIRGDGPRILALASAGVLVMIALSLRSLKRTAVVALPLFAGLTCLAGAMHLAGVTLNFLNVVVLPSLLTIAVDNSVHLYHRYEEEGPGSLRRVMASTGFAALVATASNATGYGALLVARHAGLRSVGVLSLLGVLCAFLGTTVLFPALLAALELRRARSAARPGEPPLARAPGSTASTGLSASSGET
ncbi:MAG: MMPL family transporter [Polyangiaceae bacterium]